MPHGDCAVQDDLTLNWVQPMHWIEVINELPGYESSLRNAFSALILSQAGKESQDPQLARTSTTLYGQALQDLQLALRDPERIYSDEVLIASMLLGVYEIFEGSTADPDSWLSHARGAARLIELRRPERHRTRHAHHAFLASRIPTIYASILQRRATYLAEQEWRTLPWESQHRTYMDRLIDLVTELPGLLERIDSIGATTPSSDTHSEQRELLNRLADLQKAMSAWKRYMKKEAMGQTVKHGVSDDDDSYPFDKELWFENHVYANANSVYYACSLVVAESTMQLTAAIAAGSPKASHADILGIQAACDARFYATSIAQMVPYCLQPDMGALGACIINSPAILALRYFDKNGDARVTSWLTYVFQQTKKRGCHFDSPTYEPQCTWSGVERLRLSPAIKTECSEDESEVSVISNTCERRSSLVIVKFVREDPSRYYIDATPSKSQLGEMTIRSKDAR
jgi:Fungal specific transcription factor domain